MINIIHNFTLFIYYHKRKLGKNLNKIYVLILKLIFTACVICIGFAQNNKNNKSYYYFVVIHNVKYHFQRLFFSKNIIHI